MSLDNPELRTRKPTAAVPWPLVLVEGEEKAGKSWVAALLTTSAKIGPSWWLDLGEGSADEYAAIPGTDYLVLEHDGTYAAVLEQIIAAKAEAAKIAAGDPPAVLIVDSASDIWNGLKDWVSSRARHSAKNKAKIAEDPAAELDVSRNLWNDAGTRYRRLTTHLLTFPGIVVVTARGKEVSATDPATGQPYRGAEAGRRDYSVDAHKSLPYDATVWLRMSRTRPPVVIGARSVYAGIKPGHDEPQPITADPDNLLEWLVFDVLKCNPAAAHTRDLKALTGGNLLPEEREAEQAEERAQSPAKQTQGRQTRGDTSEAASGQQAPRTDHPGDAPDTSTAASAPAAAVEAFPEAALELIRRVKVEDSYDTVRAEWAPANGAGHLGLAIPPDELPDQLVEEEVDLDAPVTVGAYLMAVGRRLQAGRGPLIKPEVAEPGPLRQAMTAAGDEEPAPAADEPVVEDPPTLDNNPLDAPLPA